MTQEGEKIYPGRKVNPSPTPRNEIFKEKKIRLNARAKTSEKLQRKTKIHRTRKQGPLPSLLKLLISVGIRLLSVLSKTGNKR